ncbi:competence type IV pilus major pilin ComGC [Bacillus thermotolerans]|uniref:ComG operon protein 3 n=1 Tax=Bacillus thermotolerans TaxID=1221996 RepID=A0A0F5HVG5_BACTR|nr:competence type IV pilus major pilin ComGC [Bacillus thermotolerans]KKB37276.1 Late competence protein ComGC [Bacillus thermotolerans]KKB42926.1 Late competence protein ComGC [Bacillus thermotolerans]KKB43832.1 Late competence protein ComGC [Bacillus thermotolerans]
MIKTLFSKDERAFTLIEMMIVLLVISVLLFVAIPNIAKQSNNINDKGCEAFRHMVEGQVQAYRIDMDKYPASVAEMVETGYLRSNETACPNGQQLEIKAGGEVAIVS